MGLLRRTLDGTLAAAAGTIVLDLASYGDMAWRGRPASSAPGELVKRMAAAAEIASLTGDDEPTANRRNAVGALLGYANGLAVGALYGAASPAVRRLPRPMTAIAIALAAMAVADVPYAKMGVSDPKTWSTSDWLSDALPHLLYGMTLVAVFGAFDARAKSAATSTSSAPAKETS